VIRNTLIIGFISAISLAIANIQKKHQTFQEKYKKYSDELESWVNQAKGQKQKIARANAKIIALNAFEYMKPFPLALPKEDYYLGLQELGLDELPPGLSQISVITDVDLFGNNLTNADQILDLPNLRELNLNNNLQLKRLPVTTEDHESLEIMTCNQCCIQDIDSRIKHLKKLSVLSLAGNEIKEVPEEIKACENLRTLEIHNNKINKPLPKSLEQCTKLRDLRTDTDVKTRNENKEIFVTIRSNAEKYRETHNTQKSDLTSAEINELIANGDTAITNLFVKYPAVSSFFQGLQTTPAWTQQKDNCIQDIRQIINRMLTDPAYSDRCIGMANEGTTSCIDRATYYYLLMLIELKSKSITKDSPLKDILNFAKTRAMIDITYQAAEKNILQEDTKKRSTHNTTNIQQENQKEETEYYLAYLENVRDVLKIELPDMQFGHFINLDQKLLSENRSKLQNDNAMHAAASKIVLSDDYLSQCRDITTLLAPIDEHFGQQLEECLLNKNTPERDIKVKVEALQAEKLSYQCSILMELYEGKSVASVKRTIQKGLDKSVKPKKNKKRLTTSWLPFKFEKKQNKLSLNSQKHKEQLKQSIAQARQNQKRTKP
jgi:hypothetical protein